MDKKKRIFLFTALASCIFILVLVAVLKGRDNKVPDTTEIRVEKEKATIISELEQKLSDIRTSDDSLPDMSEDEISSAVDLLHEKGMDYKKITPQDLRHANDVVPDSERYTHIELEKAGLLSILGDEPKNPFVFWILPDRIENGYNISIDADNELIDRRYLYDWNYAKTYYVHDFDYLLRDEEQLKGNIGKSYSELLTDCNAYISYHGLDANEFLSPGEEGRFVLLRWFKFKDSNKEGWAVCYVDVINNSDEKRAKRDCPMTQILFEI